MGFLVIEILMFYVANILAEFYASFKICFYFFNHFLSAWMILLISSGQLDYNAFIAILMGLHKLWGWLLDSETSFPVVTGTILEENAFWPKTNA